MNIEASADGEREELNKEREAALRVYETCLRNEEKSKNTIEKYLRDARHFLCFLGGKELFREQVLEYKEYLGCHYRTSSANSMLAALNRYLRFLGKEEFCVRLFKAQHRIFREKERDLNEKDYWKLVRAAREKGDERLCCIMQTLAATGIRVGELPFITVETLKNQIVEIDFKNKRRIILLPDSLKEILLDYCQKKNIRSGSVFKTRAGKPVDRRNIWAAMKLLCKEAGVTPQKVFPHNIRHLFAKCFYEKKKDIVRLADYLGHSSIETTRRYLMTSTLTSCLKELEIGLIHPLTESTAGHKKQRNVSYAV